MTQDKSAGLQLPVSESARARARTRARARADAPAPEITLGFPEDEAPTASLPNPLLQQLLRGTLPTASERPLAAVAVPLRAAAHTPPASLEVPAEPDASPTVIVVPASAEQTERIQRRRRSAHAKPQRRASLGRVTAAGLFVAAVGGAVVWRSEVADALRALAHVVG